MVFVTCPVSRFPLYISKLVVVLGGVFEFFSFVLFGFLQFDGGGGNFYLILGQIGSSSIEPRSIHFYWIRGVFYGITTNVFCAIDRYILHLMQCDNVGIQIKTFSWTFFLSNDRNARDWQRVCILFFGGQWIQNGSLFFPRACFSVVHTHPLRRREGRAGGGGWIVSTYQWTEKKLFGLYCHSTIAACESKRCL